MPDRSLHREEGHQVMGPVQGNTTDSPPSDGVCTKLDRIGTLAEQMPQTALRSLSHCLDSQLIWVAYRMTRRDAAAGVDGETYEDFQDGLFERLDQLVDQAHKGTYRAPPVRRGELRKCAETNDRGSTGWHVPELAKGVASESLPSKTQGRATRNAVSKNCTLSKLSRPTA